MRTRFTELIGCRVPIQLAGMGWVALAGTDTVRTETFSTMWPHAPHRVLPSCVDAVRRATGNTVGTIDLGGLSISIPRLGPQAPTRATTGDIAAMPLYAGRGVAVVTEIRPAGEVVTELASGAARLLGQVGVAA